MRACCILSQRIITRDEIDSVDLYLLHFCKSFQRLYGNECFTPNLHLHMHLKECFTAFGPSHSFWCFPFERYNGLLGSYSTNKKAIEVQVMRKFCTSQNAHSLIHHADQDLLAVLPLSKVRNASLSKLFTDDESVLSLIKMSHAPLDAIASFHNGGEVSLLPPLHEGVFSSEDLAELSLIYSQLYPDFEISHLSHFHTQCSRVTLGGEYIGSLKSRTDTSAVVMAYWPGRGDDLSLIDYSSRMRVGIVQHYIRHNVILHTDQELVKGPQLEHVFAYVAWKKKHPEEDWFGVSATVCHDIFEPTGSCMYLPVQRINCRCASAVLPVHICGVTENVFVCLSTLVPRYSCLLTTEKLPRAKYKSIGSAIPSGSERLAGLISWKPEVSAGSECLLLLHCRAAASLRFCSSQCHLSQ